jgi:probable HAF family extracellular repeat protein
MIMYSRINNVKTVGLNALLALTLLLADKAYAEVKYTVTDLMSSGQFIELPSGTGTPVIYDPSPYIYSYASDINNSGQVTGYIDLSGAGFTSPFITNNGAPIGIVNVYEGGRQNYGIGINDLGQVTGGWVSLGPSGGFVTDSSGQVITTFTSANSWMDGAAGLAINNSGLITGYRDGKAFKTDSNGQLNNLDFGTLGGVSSVGEGINDAGLVTGTFWTGGDPNPIIANAFVTNSNGEPIALGALGGSGSQGLGINASGQVTGWAETSDGKQHAFITDSSGGLIDLHTLGAVSRGLDINASGQVVGFYDSGDPNSSFDDRAFVTQNGVMKDLNSLLLNNIDANGNTTEWIIHSASGINDKGQIAATAWIRYPNDLTPSKAILLTPSVPVPAAIWLFGSGLFSLLIIKRKEKGFALTLSPPIRSERTVTIRFYGSM